MRSVEHDAVRSQAIYHWCSRNNTTVATERVIALLIGGNEENLATH
jgi:hypothetical protein